MDYFVTFLNHIITDPWYNNSMSKEAIKQKLLKNVTGKTVLVYSDNNITDTIKYCFLLKTLYQYAKKIIFVTQKDVIKLLKLSDFNFEIYPLEIDLKSLKYDCLINLTELKSLYETAQSAYLNINPADIRQFRAMYVRDQRRFHVGIMLPQIDYKIFKILMPLKDVYLNIFNRCEHEYCYNIRDWDSYIHDLYELACAIMCMHIVISSDPLVTNLAGALGKKVFAIYNKNETPNKYCKSIKIFKPKKQNDWENIFPVVKLELEDYRVELREKYLLSCAEQIKKDTLQSKFGNLGLISIVYSNLYGATYKNEYIYKYIETQIEQLEIEPDNIKCMGNLATFYGFHTSEKEKAKKYWDKIISTIKDNPQEYPDFLFNWACLQCQNHNFDEFLKYYEYRFKKKQDPTRINTLKQPRWEGETNVSDKTLLVHFEQGYGDTFQFCRYINDAKQLFKKVILVTQNSTEELMAYNFPDVEVYSDAQFIEKQNDVNFDMYIPLMSLGYALNFHPDNYTKKSWLKADVQKIEEYKKYFSQNTYNVGIFWDSNKSNIKRFTDLKTLIPLGKIENVQLYSLEINKEDFELNYLDENIKVINVGKHFKNFSDTAAAIENCDLIVSTDSGVMNLAGALGKKTFALFNQFPEWRWYKLDGENVGWYETVKPFQAKKGSNYKPAIKKISEEIKDLIKNDERFK